MKALSLLLPALAISIAANATVLTVNNNTPTPGQYASLPAAVAAANPGDTLYISGSVYNYNSVTIDKKLTLIGTGHKPQSTNPTVSRLDNIYFSGTATTLYGCEFIGLDVSTINYSMNIKNNLITRCKIRDYVFIGFDMDSMTVEGNYFESSGYNIQVSAGYTNTNIVIKNNVFNGRFYQFYPGAGYNLYVKNNLFLYPGSVFEGSNRYITFSNNIFYRCFLTSGISQSTFINNISYHPTTSTPFPTGGITLSGNLEDTNPLFVNFPAAGDYYGYNYDFSLQSISPAINAGDDGKDIGLTGGDGYFQKYGIPAVPQIRSFSITSPANATVNPGGTIQVNVKSTIKR